jgi:hypothetical protein
MTDEALNGICDEMGILKALNGICDEIKLLKKEVEILKLRSIPRVKFKRQETQSGIQLQGVTTVFASGTVIGTSLVQVSSSEARLVFIVRVEGGAVEMVDAGACSALEE